jgi:hypothetical protein
MNECAVGKWSRQGTGSRNNRCRAAKHQVKVLHFAGDVMAALPTGLPERSRLFVLAGYLLCLVGI